MQTTGALESHSFPCTTCTATEKLHLEREDTHLSLCCSSSLSVANFVHLYWTIISLLFEIVTDLEFEFKNLKLIDIQTNPPLSGLPVYVAQITSKPDFMKWM